MCSRDEWNSCRRNLRKSALSVYSLEAKEIMEYVLEILVRLMTTYSLVLRESRRGRPRCDALAAPGYERYLGMHIAGKTRSVPWQPKLSSCRSQGLWVQTSHRGWTRPWQFHPQSKVSCVPVYNKRARTYCLIPAPIARHQITILTLAFEINSFR